MEQRWRLGIACLFALGTGLAAVHLGAAAPQIMPGQPPFGRPPSPRQPPIMRPPEAPTEPETRPTFRTRTEVIEVAVIPTDKDGRFVADLQQKDFTLLEEGKEQKIAAFTRVDVPVTSPAPAATATGAGGGAKPGPPPPPDVASSDLSADTRIFVLVLDALHVERRRSMAVRTRAHEFVERHVAPSDLVAVVVPGGNNTMLGFTQDRARLFETIDTFQGTKLLSATVERDVDQRLGTSGLRDGRDPSDGERAWRAQASMDALAQIARFLAHVPQRRKAILFFSEGVDYNTSDVMGTVQRYASEVSKATAAAISAATRANVTFYAVDPRGLASSEGDQLETPIHREFAQTPSLADPGVRGEFTESVTSLRTISEGTGGFALVDRNSFGEGFGRIITESSRYYVLAYTPSKPARDGEYRKIEVKVSRPGITVVARKGYVTAREADAVATKKDEGKGGSGNSDGANAGVVPPANVSPELGRLLVSPLPNAGLPIRVHAVALKGAGTIPDGTGPANVQLVTEIVGSSLAFSQKGDRFVENIELALVTVDDHGRAANGTSTMMGLKLTAEEHQRVQVTGVRWLSRLSLKPGRYQIRVAAGAAGGTKRGVAIADVEVPPFDAGKLAFSGVTLTSLPSVLMVTSGGASALTMLPSPPTATRQFMVGDRITAVTEVYPPATAQEIEVTARVESIDGVSKWNSAQRLTRDAIRDGRGEVAFEFGTDTLTPGRYVLRVVGPPAAGDRIERRVPFEVVGR